MSRFVFILGAGASAEAGAPLMFDFLDKAERLLATGAVGAEYEESFSLVFNGIDALQQTYAKSIVDSDNLEAVFAAFEMAALFKGRLGKLSPNEVVGLKTAIRRVIVRTLELSVRFPQGRGGVLPPGAYGAFADLLQELAGPDPSRAAVMTFNYDIALDYALHFNKMPIDYCFEPEEMPADRGRHPLMKLHGSLNWLGCEKCGTRAWNMSEALRVPSVQQARSPDGSMLMLIGSNLQRARRCCKPEAIDGRPIGTAEEPVIVPPTWSKGEHHARIANVWRRAARHLSEAEHIIVIGYSLPDSDHFFRYLFALGTLGPARLKTLLVVDPDKTGALAGRFERMLGPLAAKRFRVESTPFSEGLEEVRKVLGLGTTGPRITAL